MFVPLVAAIITMRFVAHEGWRAFGLSKGKPTYYLLAIVYPFAVLGLLIAPSPDEHTTIPLGFPALFIIAMASYLGLRRRGGA